MFNTTLTGPGLGQRWVWDDMGDGRWDGRLWDGWIRDGRLLWDRGDGRLLETYNYSFQLTLPTISSTISSISFFIKK